MTLYHGTSTAAGVGLFLLPPAVTGQEPPHERGRVERGRVYATPDREYAHIYAGRAVAAYGGDPVVYRAIVPDDLIQIESTRPGARIVSAAWAWREEVGP